MTCHVYTESSGSCLPAKYINCDPILRSLSVKLYTYKFAGNYNWSKDEDRNHCSDCLLDQAMRTRLISAAILFAFALSLFSIESKTLDPYKASHFDLSLFLCFPLLHLYCLNSYEWRLFSLITEFLLLLVRKGENSVS